MTVNGASAAELMDMAMNNELDIPEEEVGTEENEAGEEPEGNIEDTDNEVDVDAEGDTEGAGDGQDTETQEAEEGDGDGTAQDIEESGEEAEDADEGEPEKAEDAADDEGDDADDEEAGADEDGEESTQSTDGEKGENEDIDIEEYKRVKEEHEQLKDFYDKLTKTEFTVNGRKRTGFEDPEAWIKAAQAQGGLEKKFKAIKDVEKIVPSLRKHGFIEDPNKLELATRAVEGDLSAIKAIMDQHKIDPVEAFELSDDGDKLKYEAKGDMVASDVDIVYKEAVDYASELGVSERFNRALFDEFDEASQAKIFEDPKKAQAMTAALAEQLENGLYDKVMDLVDKRSVVDRQFAAKSMLEKYDEAAVEVNRMLAEAGQAEKEAAKAAAEEAKRVEVEKRKIAEAKKKKEYEAKAKEQEKQKDAARRKASKVSKPKPGNTSTTKKSSPLDLPRDEFLAVWDDLLAMNGN